MPRRKFVKSGFLFFCFVDVIFPGIAFDPGFICVEMLRTEEQTVLWRMKKAKPGPRRLHIGGEVKSAGWEVLNATPGPHVDHVCNADTMSRFADNTFSEIYASHVVEHLEYGRKLLAALKEWNRTLEPGGKIFVSVPDLDVLAALFLEKRQLTFEERFHVMRMIFGGQIDKFDYHVAGLNEEFLTDFLRRSGYTNIKRVQDFGLFNDGSTLKFKGVPVSVNLTAEKSRKNERRKSRGANDLRCAIIATCSWIPLLSDVGSFAGVGPV